HFATAAGIAETPISVARAAYWQGRAAEAQARPEEARAHYLRAGEHPIAYYGQLARARIGDATLALRSKPADDGSRQAFERSAAAQALKLLYAI
ncbi:hypothetical protein NK983_27450, partial [Salmonella enterica subsp. enterica serovar Typhimurium]|nr:hypothetical protein [Salmonella enterica subsp. enterica serovar Typhimurium]